jgi:peptidoglycan hydrolase-like protein with peptidoglycan-binding domain
VVAWTVADEPELAQGAQNEWVTYLQQMLAHLGVFQGDAHGTFDEDTKAAVDAIQQRYAIDEGGRVGEQTWKLFAMARDKPDEGAGYEQLDSSVDTVDAPEFESEGTA